MAATMPRRMLCSGLERVAQLQTEGETVLPDCVLTELLGYRIFVVLVENVVEVGVATEAGQPLAEQIAPAEGEIGDGRSGYAVAGERLPGSHYQQLWTALGAPRQRKDDACRTEVVRRVGQAISALGARQPAFPAGS